MKCKTKYIVVCRLVDCEEDWGMFPLCGETREGYEDGEPVVFDSVAEARRAMRADYRELVEQYDAESSAKGKDPCKRKVGRDEISIDIPIWDGDNQRDSWLHAKWKVVGL